MGLLDIQGTVSREMEKISASTGKATVEGFRVGAKILAKAITDKMEELDQKNRCACDCCCGDKKSS